MNRHEMVVESTPTEEDISQTKEDIDPTQNSEAEPHDEDMQDPARSTSPSTRATTWGSGISEPQSQPSTTTPTPATTWGTETVIYDPAAATSGPQQMSRDDIPMQDISPSKEDPSSPGEMTSAGLETGVTTPISNMALGGPREGVIQDEPERTR